MVLFRLGWFEEMLYLELALYVLDITTSLDLFHFVLDFSFFFVILHNNKITNYINLKI